MKLTRRQFLLWAGSATTAGSALLAACSSKARSRGVNVISWAGYFGKDTLPRFEAETGLRVTQDVYWSEAALLDKLRAGRGGYDLVIAPDHMIPRLRREGLLAPMPHDRLSVSGGFLERFRDPAYDRGLACSVPYLWGTTGLAFATARFRRAPESWSALFDPANGGRLSMLDEPMEGLQCALLTLGLPSGPLDEARLRRAADLLRRQRPLVKAYDSTDYLDKLSSGELWLAQAWSGDAVLASAGGKVGYVIPREGALLWVDSLCLAKGGAGTGGAVRLIEYLLRPAVWASIAGAARYAPAGEQAAAAAPELKADPRIYPPAEMQARLRLPAPLDERLERLWEGLWGEITG